MQIISFPFPSRASDVEDQPFVIPSEAEESPDIVWPF